jgi:hypothetical protein
MCCKDYYSNLLEFLIRLIINNVNKKEKNKFSKIL